MSKRPLCIESQVPTTPNVQGITNFLTCRSRHAGRCIRRLPRYVCFLPDMRVMIDAVCQFADWLEFYAQALELNVWTSALVEKLGKDEKGQWNVTVRRGGPNGSLRILHPTHVIIASGRFGNPYVPHFEGKVCRPTTRELMLGIHIFSVRRKASRERSSTRPSSLARGIMPGRKWL